MSSACPIPTLCCALSKEPNGLDSAKDCDFKGLSGLWHFSTFSEDQWVQDLVVVANRCRKHPAVIGLDLFNEPHDAARGDTGR